MYGEPETNSMLANLDAEMASVAAKCKNYPKQIPACLQNLKVSNILEGALLGRSTSKAATEQKSE